MWRPSCPSTSVEGTIPPNGLAPSALHQLQMHGLPRLPRLPRWPMSSCPARRFECRGSIVTQCESSPIYSFLRLFWLFGVPCNLHELEDRVSASAKKGYWNSTGTALNLQDTMGDSDILLLSLPIHEHRKPFHSLRSLPYQPAVCSVQMSDHAG